MTGIFAPAQLAGYVALALGVTAFLQRRDQRLRAMIACQSVVYVAHFALLGNAAAAAGAGVSATRSFMSLRFRSAWLAFFFVALVLGLGLHFVHSPAGWLPIVGSSISTVAVFLCRGITLRVVILVSTALWLANNVISGSIGGTILEVFIGAANALTIVRLMLERRKPGDGIDVRPEDAGCARSSGNAPTSCRP